MSALPIALVPQRHTLVDHMADVDAILDTLAGLDDETLTDEARDELSAMLNRAVSGTKAKIDSTARVLANLEAAEAAAKAEAARLDARAKYFSRQQERLTDYLKAVMTASNLTRLEGHTSGIALRLNPPAVVPDASVAGPLAPEFVRPPKPMPWEIDKNSIKAAIGAGREVPGFATARASRLVRS